MQKRVWIIGIAAVIVLGGGIFAYPMLSTSSDTVAPKPNNALPVITMPPSQTASPTATDTPTPSPTATATITPTATLTTTLSTRVAHMTVVMPDVTLPASATPLPDGLEVLAEPPEPVAPLPNATRLPAPYDDFIAWVAFESDHPAVQYIAGNWIAIGSQQASRGQYHYTEDTDAIMRFTFSGAAMQVRYVGFTNGGTWDIVVDGQILDTIDAYAPTGIFPTSPVYWLGSGDHTLELRNTDNANDASTGHMLALDAIHVYQPDTLTLILPGGALPTATATPTLIPAESIELIQAPPSPQPTATAIPIQVVSASIVVGYDENANSVIDVSEGVRGISVRLIEVGTNRIVAHAFTNEQGFAQLQASTNSPVQLVVPYFGEAWAVQTRNTSGPQAFTLLLSPGNQPGLIP